MRSLLSSALVFLLTACPSTGGKDGEPGPRGETGLAGTAGQPGAKGDRGDKGETGDKGDPGMVLVLDGGVVTGPRGLPGTSVTASSVDAGNPTCIMGGVLLQLADGGGLYVCNGLTGPAGAVGANGAIGPMGTAGAVGANGAIGPMGPAGTTGATGPAGTTGAIGPMGPTGTTGAVGATGATGPAGPAGTGAPGPQGPAGAPGGTSLEDSVGFAGFTTATFSGAIPNGRTGAHQACASQFAGGHMCHAAEFLAANSAATVPDGGAWIDSSIGFADSSLVYSGGPMTGRGTQYSCSNWTSGASGTASTTVYVSGGVGYDTSPYCANVRPIACCNGSSRTRHRGFTTATTTGAIPNGRPGAHAMCAQQFPGSHFCHASEYIRSNSLIVPPATGAWIDSSISGDGAIAYGGSPLFGRGQQYTCANWTSGASGTASTVLYPSGGVGYDVSPYCATVRSLACCD